MFILTQLPPHLWQGRHVENVALIVAVIVKHNNTITQSGFDQLVMCSNIPWVTFIRPIGYM